MGRPGRPISPGGEFYFLPPGYMEDPRTFALFKAQGYTGIVVHLWLMEQIKNNYFWDFGPGAADVCAQRMVGQPSTAQVKNIIMTLCRVGYFDEALFRHYSVLTSEWHQQRYVTYVSAKKSAEKKHVVYKDFWLLSEDDIVPETKLKRFLERAVFRALKNNSTEEKTDFTMGKLDFTMGKSNYAEHKGMERNGMVWEPPNPQNEPCLKLSGKPGPEKKGDQVSHVLRLLRKRTGNDYVGDNAARILVYKLFERGYTKRDALAVTNKVCDMAEAGQDVDTSPAALYNPVSFDVRIIDDRMDVMLKHPEQERDHYTPLRSSQR